MGVRRHATAGFTTGTVYWQKLVTSLLGNTVEGKTLHIQGILVFKSSGTVVIT